VAIEKLVLESGRVSWRARWRDDRNRQRSKSFRRKIDAERFMTELDHAKHSGAYVDPAAGRMKLGDWAERWLVSQMHLKPKTVAGYRSLLGTCVLPRWGSVPLGGDHVQRRGRVGQRPATRRSFRFQGAAGLSPADRNAARCGKGRPPSAESRCGS
jgi:hypothetical protein